MTPQELDSIRQEVDYCEAFDDDVWAGYAKQLLDYIDLLHEDLALTRQERDHAKHQALEHRKARARAEYDLLARDEKDTE